MPAATKDRMIAGPACVAAATPVSTKMPVPIICPMPMKVRSQAVRHRRRPWISSAAGNFLANRFMATSDLSAAIGIEGARQAFGGNHGEAQSQGAAPARSQHLALGIADDRTAEAIRHEEPCG